MLHHATETERLLERCTLGYPFAAAASPLTVGHGILCGATLLQDDECRPIARALKGGNLDHVVGHDDCERNAACWDQLPKAVARAGRL